MLFAAQVESGKPAGDILLGLPVRRRVDLSGRPVVSARAAVRLGPVARSTPGSGIVPGYIAAAAVPERGVTAPAAATVSSATAAPRAIRRWEFRVLILLSTAPFLSV